MYSVSDIIIVFPPTLPTVAPIVMPSNVPSYLITASIEQPCPVISEAVEQFVSEAEPLAGVPLREEPYCIPKNPSYAETYI